MDSAVSSESVKITHTQAHGHMNITFTTEQEIRHTHTLYNFYRYIILGKRKESGISLMVFLKECNAPVQTFHDVAQFIKDNP